MAGGKPMTTAVNDDIYHLSPKQYREIDAINPDWLQPEFSYVDTTALIDMLIAQCKLRQEGLLYCDAELEDALNHIHKAKQRALRG